MESVYELSLSMQDGVLNAEKSVVRLLTERITHRETGGSIRLVEQCNGVNVIDRDRQATRYPVLALL
jgi:hypothetical protein